MKKQELNKIIERHQHWLNKDCKGWSDMRADLTGADLSGADLHGVDLSDADLSDADLTEADLRDAILCWAKLSNAEIGGANLAGANLNGADLRDADLSHADLTYTYLRDADLSGANLVGVSLRDSVLCGAKLFHAAMTRASLADAELDENTVLDGVIYDEATAFFKPCCPEEGSFVAFKKATIYNTSRSKVIVKLQVPAKAQRSSATSRKCRVSEAKVISITSLDGKKSFKKARAEYTKSFIYEVGKTVKVKDFDPCRWKECAPGIHCFITRDEAVNY